MTQTMSAFVATKHSISDSRIAKQADGWQASLYLQLRHRPQRTVLQVAEHRGPLRVQRPFYPEGATCHLYLLHPPGGLVGGDKLTISLDVKPAAQALITTPAAGKLYRVSAQASPQFQGVHAQVGARSSLEWLPQETILFDGARGELRNLFELDAGASLIGWDIICLGRRASGEKFTTGHVKQSIEIAREGRPLFIDRINIKGGSDMLNASWGLAGYSVMGTMFATVTDDIHLDLDELRQQLPATKHWGLTLRNNVLLVRFIGDSAELCRQGFESIWCKLRPVLLSRPVLRPRIWNT